MRKILVPASASKIDLVVFETALAVARPLGAHLAFLHVHLDASQAALHMPHVEFARGAALRNALDHLREQCESRARTAKNEHVDLVSVCDAADSTTEAVGEIVEQLRCNGIAAISRVCSLDGWTTADRLAMAAHESDASLLVMGGYGHWRAREVLFGGCTQAALEIGELPVFVVH
jgi:nucleotide-binding universal stress UspA family protein